MISYFCQLNNLNLNLPSVIGSDAHHPNKVGRAFTWIKMSNPCIEGLKLSLIDGTSSLIRPDDIEENGNPNLFSNLIFKSLVVKNSKYAGRSVPLNIDFNPWLNCIIGSRGSGKSSILEFIRIVMDRSNEVLELRDTNEIRKSFESFLKIPIAKDAEGVMTANSQIECIYEKDGATYSLIWNKSDNLVKIKKLISNNWVDEVGSVNSRFPIKIFSQKQIFDLAKDPTSLLKFIDESLTVNIQNWKMEWEVAVSHLKTLYSQQREKRAKISNKNILLGQSLDINHKIKLIESSNHSVLFEKHQKVIRKKSGVDKLYSELKFFIDNSKEMINVCIEKCNHYKTKHIHPLYIDLENDNLSKEFDFIYSQMALHHIKDVELLLKKLYSMLSEGGVVAIADLYSEDGSFHGLDADVHKGFDPVKLSELFRLIRFKSVSYSQCYSLTRENGISYPIFLMVARKG